MEQEFRHQADGCHSHSAEPADHPLPPADRLPLVRFCSWCKEIVIRPKAVRAEDALILYVYGQERKALWNGREVLIADGICEQCRAKEFPETLKKGTTP